MKMNTSWAFASAAVVAILVAGCTTETTDDTEGGVSTTGTAGSSAAGSAGAGGSNSSAGSSGAGGSSSGTDAGVEPMSVCEKCAYDKCNTTKQVDMCEADTNGCGAHVDEFYVCISKAGADEAGCAAMFATDANGSDAGGDLANELASCMVAANGCLDLCQGVDGGK